MSGRSPDFNELDAKENHRREQARLYINDLAQEERRAAQLEENEKIGIYEQQKTEALTGRSTHQPSPATPQSSPIATGVFKCEHAGCTAAPFQTQYILKYNPRGNRNIYSANAFQVLT